MVMTSKVPQGAIALLALCMGACTPGGDAREFERADEDQSTRLTAHFDPRISAAQSSLSLASAALENQDPRAGLEELLTAADLMSVLSPADDGFCELGIQTVQISDEMLAQGAYAEARMGYAIAVSFTQGCESALPEQLSADSLRLRQQDARAVHQWAIASADQVTSAAPG